MYSYLRLYFLWCIKSIISCAIVLRACPYATNPSRPYQTKRKRVDSDSEFEIKSSSAKANSSKTNGTSKKVGPPQKKNKKRNNESDDDFVPNGVKVEKDIDGDVIMKDAKFKGIEKEESEDDIPLAKLTMKSKLCVWAPIHWWFKF